jgi:hypothetical protein
MPLDGEGSVGAFQEKLGVLSEVMKPVVGLDRVGAFGSTVSTITIYAVEEYPPELPALSIALACQYQVPSASGLPEGTV